MQNIDQILQIEFRKKKIQNFNKKRKKLKNLFFSFLSTKK